jgi:hypothetical protein
MPGPCSEPAARHPQTGALIYGKTRLARAGLTSRSGMAAPDWKASQRVDTRRAPEHDRTRDPLERLEEKE